MARDLFLLWLGGALACSFYVLCEFKRGLGASAELTASILPGRFFFALVFSILIWPFSLFRIYQMSGEVDDQDDDQEDDDQDDADESADAPPPRAVAVPAPSSPASPAIREAPE